MCLHMRALGLVLVGMRGELVCMGGAEMPGERTSVESRVWGRRTRVKSRACLPCVFAWVRMSNDPCYMFRTTNGQDPNGFYSNLDCLPLN